MVISGVDITIKSVIDNTKFIVLEPFNFNNLSC